MSKNNPLSGLSSSSAKSLAASSIILLLLLIGSGSYFLLKGEAAIIDWSIISFLKEGVAEVASQNAGGLTFQNLEPYFYITEKYVPTGINVHVFPAYFYLLCIVVGLSLYLSSAVKLSGKWFLAGIVLLGVVLLSFNLEIVFNQLSKTAFLVAFLGIGGLTYYFNSWAKPQSIGKIFAIYLLIFAGLVLYIYFDAKVELPFLAMANYSTVFLLLVSAIFIFFIAHELIGGLLYITTNASTGNGSVVLRQFVTASTIYLLNLLLIYLENANRISFSPVVIDPWWIYVASLIAGFWGFQQYCQQTEEMSYSKNGIWLYLGGGIITTVTLFYVYATNNTPWIELIADYFSITFLVVGIVFFFHIIINFYGPLRRGLAVYKVMYKPKFSRLVLARIVAVFGIVGLFALKNGYSVSQYVAGYYNSLGDYALKVNDLFPAETYYKQSVAYDTYNHKGNYALGSLAKSQQNPTTAGFYFKQATQKSPSEFAYAALSESLQDAELFFDASFVLQEGIKVFPKGQYLPTNLSRQFAKSNVLDSTYLYADMALRNCWKCQVEKTNMLSFWIENAKSTHLDSASKALYDEKYIPSVAGMAGIKKRQQQSTDDESIHFKKDSILSVGDFALMYNVGTNPANKKPVPVSLLDACLRQPENAGYYSDLAFVKAKQMYQFGDKTQALQLMDYLTRDETTETRLYTLTLAQWLLNEGVYNKSMDYFLQAGDTTSVRNLELAGYRSKIDRLQQKEAEEFAKEALTLNNYRNKLARMPYNPYYVEKVVNFLNAQNKLQDAYQVVYDAVQINDQSVLLWKLYVKEAQLNGLSTYAQDGLKNLKKLMSSEDFERFYAEYAQNTLSDDDF